MKFVVGICGASGVIYGIELLKALLKNPFEIHLIISQAGKIVLKHETDYSHEPIKTFLNKQKFQFHAKATLTEYTNDDFFAPPASRSFKHNGMIIAPCSMKTAASISAGISENLIGRAADVCLKEKRTLILLPRETPFSLIHLQNLTNLASAGATIMPPSPAFYFQPKSINDLVNFVVARILDHLYVEHSLLKEWGNKPK